MIRFLPDTPAEWLLRPLTMAAPNGWVYTEICAPDFRFAFVVAMLVAVGLMPKPRRAMAAARPLLALAALTAVAFLVWMATTGNGRYFIPFLILVGPLCIALAVRLPLSKSMRAFAIALVLTAQAFAVGQNNPWKRFDTWEWIAWREPPYFHIDTAAVAADKDVTYVTLPTMTMSLVAPQFPASVRWVNLSPFDAATPGEGQPVHMERALRMLNAKDLRLLQRTQPLATDPVTLQPVAAAVESLDRALGPFGLVLRKPVDCKFLRSKTLSELTVIPSDYTGNRKAVLERAGFWACNLERAVRAEGPPPMPSPEEQVARHVFARIEAQCPRFFPPGQARAQFNGEVYYRSYHHTDFTLLLARNGEVWTQYLRALNPQLIGTTEQVLDPAFAVDCRAFRGRGGLPWDREI